MRDAARHLAGQLQRVGAADQQVAGVQAQLDRRPGQHPVHLGAVLHHRADMRMQHRQQAPCRRPRRRADPGWPAGWPTASRRASGGSRTRRSRSPRPAPRRRRPQPPAHRAARRCRAADRAPASCSTTGTNAPDAAQPIRVQQRGQLLGIGRQEALGAQFGCRQPDVTHLGEHPFRAQLIPPAGDLAHPPGDRRACDLHCCVSVRTDPRSVPGHPGAGTLLRPRRSRRPRPRRPRWRPGRGRP